MIRSIIIFILLLCCPACLAAQPDVLDETRQIINEHYVKELNQSEINKAAAKGIIASLDPHSTYIEKHQLSNLAIAPEDSYIGIGIEIALLNHYPTILSVMEKSPAAKVGLQNGDVILEVNGRAVANMSLAEVKSSLSQSHNIIKILRGRKELEFNVKAAVVKNAPCLTKLIHNNEVAYIRVKRFSKNIAEKIRDGYEQMKKDNLKGVILDLRHNPGGLLDEAVKVTSLFLPPGLKIVSIKSGKQKRSYEFTSGADDITSDLPMVVLVNGASASAAEIVAGALQDNKKALMLGTKSFGKGSVQTAFQLSNGDALKLTTALYYTPRGKAIQGNGVEPDILVEDSMTLEKVEWVDQISESQLEKTLPADLLGEDKILQKRQLYKQALGDERHDFQLSRAIDIILALAFLTQT